jgi:hypothetical protein
MALTDTERSAIAWAGLIPVALRELAPWVEGDDEDSREGDALRIAAGIIEAAPIERWAEILAAVRTDEVDIDEGEALISAPDIAVRVE